MKKEDILSFQKHQTVGRQIYRRTLIEFVCSFFRWPFWDDKNLSPVKGEFIFCLEAENGELFSIFLAS